MLDFSTIFNQETINTQFLESIKTTFQIFIELLKMPFPIGDNHIPFGVILAISMIPVLTVLKKRKLKF